MDASEFHIDGPKMFYGFLSGIAAQDFDLEYLFIDGFLKIVHHPLETLEGLFTELEKFSDRTDVKLIISIKRNAADAPEFIKPDRQKSISCRHKKADALRPLFYACFCRSVCARGVFICALLHEMAESGGHNSFI